MKIVLLVWIILAVGTFKSNAQLSGKRASIGQYDNMFCGEEIYFHNDSIAMLMYGCEANQGLAFARYRIDRDGELCFTLIPNKEFNPIVRKYRCEMPRTSEENRRLGYADLVFKIAGDTSSGVYDDFHWRLMLDTVYLASGYRTENISFGNFADSNMCINFPVLNGLFGEDYCFRPGEFDGTGDRFVIEIIFTPNFFRYHLFSLKSDFKEVSLFYKENQLFEMVGGTKKILELENGRW
ncbi:MAG: hypothetical protein QE487_17095 [Fluviicola sp.]|nr:hypothetical protein [Fluviicola sp.]